MKRLQIEGHQWGIEQGADRGEPVGHRIRCNELVPVGKRIGCSERGTSGLYYRVNRA